MEQNFLRAILAEFRRSGLEEATFQQVGNLLFRNPSRFWSDAVKICGNFDHRVVFCLYFVVIW